MISKARHFSALTLALALAGCATEQTYIARPVELPLPAKPVLPTVGGEALQCVRDDVYTALVKRFRTLASDDNQLRAIIEANNEAAKEKTQ